MAKENRRGKRDAPKDINSLLGKILRRKQWLPRLKMHAVFDYWDEVIGPDISERAQPAFIRGSVLWVSVSDSIWMQQLHFQKMLLLDTINARLDQVKITDIKFQLKTDLMKKEPPSVQQFVEKEIDEKEKAAFENLLGPVRDEAVKSSLRDFWLKLKARE